MVEVNLRAYKTEDFDACQRIAGRSTDYAHAIDQNADAIAVAEIDNKVVGFAYIQIWRWNGIAWLGEIVVDPKYRAQGIGTQLLNRMENVAREHGCRVVMDHPPGNHPVISFYMSQGYRICGYNDRFYAEGSDTTAVFLCKELTEQR